MVTKSFVSLIVLIFLVYCKCQNIQEDPHNPARVLKKFFNQCAQKEELFKCLKIQAIKVADRALSIKSFNVVDGLTIVSNSRLGKSINGITLNDTKLEKLSPDDLDGLLHDRTTRFLDTHKIEVNIPLLAQVSGRGFIEEGRKRRRGGGKRGGGYGPLLAALAIKGSFFAMVFKGIAIMSGAALIIGKMALLLSAILGLKKLVSGNNEKTTFEIIKTPKYTEEHVHSTAYEDDNHHDHYRRNYMDAAEALQKRVYRFQLPKHC